MIARTLVIAWKELLQLRRDRLTFAMMIALPIVQLMLFGYAINTDVRHIPTVVFDQDRSVASRDLARRFEATGYFDLRGNVNNYEEIERALLSARAHAALVVPAGYSRHLVRGSETSVQVIVDGSDPQTVGSALSTASSLVSIRAAEIRRSPAGLIRFESSILYNPDQRTALNIVPGLIGVILTMTMVMFTAMALARERERGTLEQLIVSPVRQIEIVVGKILPYIMMGYVQMTLVLILGTIVFGVSVVGPVPLLFALALPFIADSLAIGLFFSTLAKTQQQAMQMSFFFLLPNILLSGFMFPYEAMPVPAQTLSQGLPLTHFLRIVRGIVLKGAHFQDLAIEVVWLVAILIVLLTLSSLRFRKKLV